MAGKRINDPSITQATLIKDDDVFYLIQDGVDHQISGAVLRATLAGMNNPMTAKGDIIVGDTAGAPVRFAIGDTGYFLSIDENHNLTWVPKPGTGPGDGLLNPMTALNDLIIGGENGVALRLEGGAEGQYITIENGIMVWKDLPAAGGAMTNPMVAVGDMIIGGALGAATRLEKGLNGDTLKIVDGVPTWVTVGSARSVVTPIDSQNGDKVLTKADDGKYMRVGTYIFDGPAPYGVTYTVSSQAEGEWLADAEITIEQSGDSQVTVKGATGVTINKQIVFTNRTRGRYAVITLKRTDQNVWTLFGQLETP